MRRTGLHVAGVDNLAKERQAPPVIPEVDVVGEEFVHVKCGTEIRLVESIEQPRGAKLVKFYCGECGGYLTLTVLKPQ